MQLNSTDTNTVFQRERQRKVTGWESEMEGGWTKVATDKSCLSFLRWNRLSSAVLTSPHMTTVLKKENGSERRRQSRERERMGRGESERRAFSSPFLASLWWLTNTNLETSTRRHWFCTGGCGCDLQCVPSATTKQSLSAETQLNKKNCNLLRGTVLFRCEHEAQQMIQVLHKVYQSCY